MTARRELVMRLREHVVRNSIGALEIEYRDELGNLIDPANYPELYDFILARYAPVTEEVNVVATSGTAQTIPSPASKSISNITLTGNCALTFPTPVAGQSLTVCLKQDATGSRTVTWGSSVIWPGGTAPTLTTTALAQDIFTFVCLDGTNWMGFTSGLDMR